MEAVRRWFLAGALVLGGLPGTVWAESEVDILLNKLVQKGVLSDVEAGEIRREINETKEARNNALAKEIVPESARDWTWNGDLRLRHEYRNQTGSGQDVNRDRIRFRYGFDANVSDDLRVGARLATGNTTSPISTNQTFDTAFNHKNFLLDRAFVEYHPALPGLDEFRVSGGMIENPFWTVGQLVWDDDLNFDGAAVHLARAFGPVTMFTNNGVFSLQTDITEAATLWSTQGGVAVTPFTDDASEPLKSLKATATLAYHDYKNVTNPASESTALTTAGGLKGNTAGLADVNMLNPTFELASQYQDIPFGFFGDFVHNTARASSNDNGFQLGVKAGKARVPFNLKKGWEGGYYFERLEPDATLGAFTDSDFVNGGTNHRGNVWWVKLAVLKHSTMQLKYLSGREIKGSKNHVETLQADWATKF